MQFLHCLTLLLGAVVASAIHTACPSAHLFLARGTTEPYPGILGSLASLVLGSVNGSTYEDIIYPAGNTPSYQQGMANGTARLESFVAKCPRSKIALLGFSQGAMVVSDMLAGGGDNGLFGNLTMPSIDAESIGRHVTAIMLYGDPRHTANQTYNVGSVGATGRFPRTACQIRELAKYAGRIKDYCNNKDGVCDASGSNTTAHWDHARVWDTTAAAWLRSVLL